MGGDPGCVFTAVESIVGVPDTLRCGIELESLLLIDIGVGVAFDIPERKLLRKGATADIDIRCTRVDVTDGAGREDGDEEVCRQ
ncbi:hypothetical protein PNOK_0654400 [Pyrrhoderma noxium]|uniref:Uncharacterized protein n=1 Tax=Pyrrhoderma noxium TaxID=2282107 RepID=A0A286UES9_9AGAM|nr:hypothetical protein PNOK_0654400 [Pyrrhoderma noxium]